MSVGATKRTETLVALQGLRGVAALLVVANHSIDNMITNADVPGNQALAYFLGDLGVSIFFVISGFVMVHAHRSDFGKRGAPYFFGLRRVCRIVPLYWLITMIYAMYLIFGHRGPTLAETIQSLLFVPYPSHSGYGYPVVGQGWTLNYEAIFYVVFGLSLLWRRGLWLVFTVFAALVTMGESGIFGQNNPMAFWASPIVLYFLAGVLIGLLRPHLSTGLSFYSTLAIAGLFLIIGILGAALMGAGSFGAQTIGVSAAIFPVVTCAWANESNSSSWLHRSAKSLGDGTYSIYLTHAFVIGAASKIVAKFAHHMPMSAFIGMMMVVCSALGIAVYRVIERPVIDGGRISLILATSSQPASSNIELSICQIRRPLLHLALLPLLWTVLLNQPVPVIVYEAF